MKYKHDIGIKKPGKARVLWTVLPLLGLLGGAYVLVNTLSPGIEAFSEAPDTTAKKLVAQQPNLVENRLYVPKVNIDVAIVDINGNETKALEKGAVHRAADNGNPLDGGNFVLAGHRFQLGLLPSQTRKKSPFYHIDLLQKGDQIYVDYKGIRYAYEISERKLVPPDAMEIENRTTEPQLTMYSCELAGPKAGREVVIARPIGTIAWVNGQPKLKTL